MNPQSTYSELSPRKRALLALLLEEEGMAGEDEYAILHRDGTGDAPMSFAQQRLWFLDQLQPGDPSYNMPGVVRLTGALDLTALQRTLNEIVRRHESLRTTFPAVERQPVQRIAPALPGTAQIHLPLIDLRALPTDVREAQMRRLARVEGTQPFDLVRGPLLRVGLLRLADAEHVFVFVMHHIIADGWSMGVLTRELATLYGAFVTGKAAPLPALPIQYADYAVWQAQWLQSPQAADQMAYWKRQLSDDLPVLALPTDRSPPPSPVFQGANADVELPRPLVDALHELNQREGTTLFMALLAALQILLARYSGQDYIAVGTVVAGRAQAETSELIGCFINSLTLRCDLSGDPSVQALLQQVRDVTLEAYAHQDLPFEKLLAELRPQRDAGQRPFFQVLFELQNTPSPVLSASGLTLRPVSLPIETAVFDLRLDVTEVPEGLVGTLEYNADMFDAPTITRMLGHFQTVLRSMTADPTQRIADVALMDEVERRQVLVAFNATPEPYARDRFFHQLFEEQARTRPDALAAVCENEQVSYATLNRRANQLAHWLCRHGLGRYDCIGVFGERGIELLVVLLATLKAGCVYVPLEPAHPDARLAAILDDSGIRLIATQAALVGRSLALARSLAKPAQVFCWETAPAEYPVSDRHSIAHEPTDDRQSALDAHDLATIFYTSGSTGVPKGVMVEQIGMLNHLWSKVDLLELHSGSIVAQTASHGFDISIWQFLAPLLAGGQVIIYANDIVLDQARFLHALQRDRVAVVETVPTLLTALLATVAELRTRGKRVALPALTHLISNAETLPVPLCRDWLAQFPRTPIINTYGATECSDDTTHHLMRTPPPADAQRVPVGTPIPGLQIYVLDAQLRPVPIGCLGQIAMAGVGVGQGYVGDAVKTARAFTPNPFAACGDTETPDAVEPQSAICNLQSAIGTRLYLTGDLGRWTAAGVLEFVGRIDGQVKVRGFRIELGEIEAALARHPAVRQSVVLARAVRPGELALVAYVILANDERRTMNDAERDPTLVLDPWSFVPELRAFLSERLPAHMLPEYWVMLDVLPLNRNGKIDRRALPPPDLSARVGETTAVTPRNETEALLAEIWSQLLGIAQVSVDDDFFGLGGHSLLATQVVSRIREALQIELPLRALFEAPTIAGLAARIARDRPAVPEPLSPSIQRVARDGDLPLSFAQQRLWFLDQLVPNSAFYNVPSAVRVRGPLDITALYRSLSGMVARHETLRTRFVALNGRPSQVIAPMLPLPLPVADLRDLPATAREALVGRLIAHEAQQPFDLARGPLLRVTMLWLAQQEYVLLLTMHHIVSDGWSISVLINELAVLYSAHALGQPSPLPELPIQYVDFAVWQRAWLSGAVQEAQLAYWKRQLAGAPTVLELASDHPRPATPTFRGASYRLALRSEEARALMAFSQREGVTLFMTLLAAFEIVLARTSNQDDFLIGTPIANRTRSELEGLVGFFANTLVLRAALAGNPSFRELLTRVRTTALDAYAHQDLPLEQLVEELHPARDLSRTPLFQVLFVLQNAPVSTLALPDASVTLQPLPIDGGTARFDMSFSVEENPGELSVWVEYSTDLFEAATITRLVGHWRQLLTHMVADPTRRLASVTLLTRAEQQHVREWNATAAPDPAPRTLHAWVAAQTARTPDAVAVALADTQLTYRELDQRANQLAHTLRARGVGPDVPVGLCVARSLAMAVGLLGILKAGGALVPLDPAYPAERLAFMCADAQVRVLITASEDAGHRTQDAGADSSFVLRPASLGSGQVIDLRAAWPTLAQAPTSAPADVIQTDHLMYVIYTSGSTGRPKGIAMSHGGLLNVLWWQAHATAQPGPTTTLQFAPLSFDASVQEIFLTWGTGGTLVLIAEALRQEPDALLRLLASRGVARLFLPFVALQQLALIARPSSNGSTLREIITAGDQLQISAAVAAWLRTLPGCTLENQYGPSESHVVTAERLPHDRAAWPLLPAIGRPIANTQVYLLDAHMQPVPIGVAGELYLGGVNLARGYFGRPDLTAERFVPNPFATTNDERRTTNDEPNARPVVRRPSSFVRLYRTGDLARYQADGRIVFLGRIDGQVKLRGYRIEPGEIEAALSRHAAVREAVVLAREDSPGDKRLVAYVVTTEDERPSSFIQELRAFLAERMPEYMLPSAFVVLDTLPLTPSGKLDRRALPAPDYVQPALETTFAAPRTPIEELLAQIWGSVLSQPRVGIHDNFFALGGHSLLATQVVSRVREALQIELPLRSLFETPTIAGLAEQIASVVRGAHDAQAPLVPSATDEYPPLSFAQQRLWFLDQLEHDTSAYHIPVAVRLLGKLDILALQRSINALIYRHESLRTTFATVDGLPVQLIAPRLTLALPLLDLRAQTAAEREAISLRLAGDEAQRPFDLAIGPLIRAMLLRLDAQTHILLVTMHHIIADGWSLSVFVRELAALYDALVAGQPVTLPALPIQYADYARWQRQWLEGATSTDQPSPMQAQLRYWQAQLADLPPLDLPTDQPRPPARSFRGASDIAALPPDLSVALDRLSRAEGSTLFMTLLAAFQVLLARYSGQDDFAIGSPIAGRTRGETEGLIGFFVNTLVLRSDLRANPTFRELARRVREVTLGAYANQDVPFEQVVEALQPERDLSRTPLFQVMFVLQNTPLPTLELRDLTLVPLVVESGIVQFDLTLVIAEDSDGMGTGIEYSTELFTNTTIRRLQGHYQQLLAGIVADPSQRIAALTMMTEAERAQLLVGWNSTAVEYPRDRCFPQLFAEQAARTPDAVAIVFDDQALSYGALNARANQLAHYLRTRAVGPDVRVGLCAPRSVELLVGALGILKAGGAYVPLDPAYPAERLRAMLADAQAQVLITAMKDEGADSSFVVRRSSFVSGQVVDLHTDWPQIARCSATDPTVPLHPGNLAYVIYTSGSTGRPKGVMVQQRGLMNLCYGLRSFFDEPSVQHAGLITSISFDISVNQIFPTLLFGRTLHVISDAVKFDSPLLLRAIVERHIQLLDGVPSYFQSVLADVAPACVRSGLRYLLIGGEKLEQHLVHAIFDQLGSQVAIVNIYGLTEITDINAFAVIRAADRAQLIMIGRPLQNNRIYLIDHASNLQPVGIVGEVCIAGASLARGYLNRPDLTAEKFVVCPFEDGTRMCRTGDMGRRRADGVIELLGRRDQQVKLRGFRIELGEIETVLAQHERVRVCAALVRMDRPGDQRLVAYIVPADDERRTTNDESADSSFVQELRAFLHARLPDYMIPSAFVLLDALPHTPSGKLDRRALPAPDYLQPDPAAFAAPRSPAEVLLAGIWSDVLGLGLVGIHDNFFALGGHSLLATQVVARLRAALHIDLPLRALFETPTIASLAARVVAAQRQTQGLLLPPLRPLPRDGMLPLSFAQQRLWFLDQLAPGNPTYNIPTLVRLTGPLDLAALVASLTAIVARHEALRTTFTTVAAQPSQWIAPPSPFSLTRVDLHALADATRAATWPKLARADAQRPFDLARGPLIRATLMRLADDDHVLLLTVHHIVADGWSLGVLIQELMACYTAHATGRAALLPALPIQYADFALWQRQWLHGDVIATQLAYWRTQLAALPTLQLPTDQPRPPIQTVAGSTFVFGVPAPLSAALNQRSQHEGVTLFMTLLTAFAITLARYSDQDDLAIGTPIAGRTHRELEGLIGFFVNTLVLRADLSGNPTLRALLARTRATALDAYAHQDLPFEQLVEELHPVRDLSRTPLFQVMFIVQNAPAAALAVPDTGLTMQPLPIDSGTARFDLLLSISEEAGGLSGWVEYRTDLFAAATITRLVGHWQQVLAQLAADPALPLSAVTLLTRAEQQHVREWNATAAPDPAPRTLHAWVAAQTARTPDAVAVALADAHVTYRELDRRASQLAHTLRARGVGPDVPVGLCVARSLAMAVGLLGILKAGGALVPLDPAYPAERLAFMCADAQVRVLITASEDAGHRTQDAGADSSFVLRPASLGSGQVIDLRAAWPTLAQAPTSAPRDLTQPDHLMYVIYTSGSTGRPKGIALPHRALVNLLWWQARTAAQPGPATTLQFAPLSFDASIQEIFLTWGTGGTLVLIAEALRQEPDALLRLLTARGVTRLFLPFVALQQLALIARPGSNGSTLREIITAGEQLQISAAIAAWLRTLPGCTLDNQYGPSESHVVTAERLPHDRAAWPLLPAIGRPIANTQVYLLDTHMQPVPIGVAGELYLGGVNLARGYFGRPDLTAERFVPNPFATTNDERRTTNDEPNARPVVLGPSSFVRLYRTGDLARYQADGRIVFLGRIDGQVKVRGYRIELNEIAAWLEQHPAVRASAVVLRAGAAEDKRLVAYVVTTEDERPKTNDEADERSFVHRPSSIVQELRAFLAEHLPEYMLPSSFVLLDALPLTPSGKIDRRALPELDVEPSVETPFVAPRTPSEQTVAAICAEILGLSQIGVDDNFFDRGGHSLLATQLISRLRDAFQLELPLQRIFESPTVAGLAKQIDTIRWMAQGEAALVNAADDDYEEGSL
jgi:amino acid adenylation domain-containing protein